MSGPRGYTIASYGDMVSCKPRMQPYAEALKRAITPGCTVLDIGAGAGIFSLLACQYGAGRVIAVEPDDSLLLARELAAANGCLDRIIFVQGLSTELALDRKADVIVSDLRGILPLFQSHIASIADARRRLLAPDGVMIPMRDTLRAALVETPKEYAFYEEPWRENAYGLYMEAGHRYAVNSWRKVNFKPEALISDVVDVAELDYRVITEPNFARTITLRAERETTAHGLLLWFDAELADGLSFSNAPGAPELIYGQAFFPLERPAPVKPGDMVCVDLRADLIDGDYVWSWRTRVFSSGETRPRCDFNQSSFLSKIVSPERMRTRAISFAPAACEAAAIDAFCLSLFDGVSSVASIAERAQSRFPAAFATIAAATAHVADLSERYAAKASKAPEGQGARKSPEAKT